MLVREPDVVGIGTSPLVHLYSFASTTASSYRGAFARRLRKDGSMFVLQRPRAGPRVEARIEELHRV